jgi:hypothetical protein
MDHGVPELVASAAVTHLVYHLFVLSCTQIVAIPIRMQIMGSAFGQLKK